jgi:hypothetical protein
VNPGFAAGDDPVLQRPDLEEVEDEAREAVAPRPRLPAEGQAEQTKKDNFSGRVLKQKTPPGTTAAPATVVPIVIGTKK